MIRFATLMLFGIAGFLVAETPHSSTAAQIEPIQGVVGLAQGIAHIRSTANPNFDISRDCFLEHQFPAGATKVYEFSPPEMMPLIDGWLSRELENSDIPADLNRFMNDPSRFLTWYTIGRSNALTQKRAERERLLAQIQRLSFVSGRPIKPEPDDSTETVRQATENETELEFPSFTRQDSVNSLLYDDLVTHLRGPLGNQVRKYWELARRFREKGAALSTVQNAMERFERERETLQNQTAVAERSLSATQRASIGLSGASPIESGLNASRQALFSGVLEALNRLTASHPNNPELIALKNQFDTLSSEAHRIAEEARGIVHATRNYMYLEFLIDMDPERSIISQAREKQLPQEILQWIAPREADLQALAKEKKDAVQASINYDLRLQVRARVNELNRVIAQLERPADYTLVHLITHTLQHRAKVPFAFIATLQQNGAGKNLFQSLETRLGIKKGPYAVYVDDRFKLLRGVSDYEPIRERVLGLPPLPEPQINGRPRPWTNSLLIPGEFAGKFFCTAHPSQPRFVGQ